MKKLLLPIFLMTFFAIKTSAQTTPKYGAYLGINSSNMSFSGDGISIKGNSVAGLRISGMAELPLTEQISIMALPGISMKGSKLVGEKVSLTYLDLPIYGVYNYDIGPGKALGGVGFYVGFALSGKSGGEKIDFSKNGDAIKRTDAGANFLLGYELPDLGVKVLLTLSPGIASISDDSDVKVKNSSFGFGVAYLLKR
jgi:hypothetical protein